MRDRSSLYWGILIGMGAIIIVITTISGIFPTGLFVDAIITLISFVALRELIPLLFIPRGRTYEDGVADSIRTFSRLINQVITTVREDQPKYPKAATDKLIVDTIKNMLILE